MTGLQMVLSVLLLVSIGGGAFVIGFVMRDRNSKPNLKMIGLAVFASGLVLGYAVVELFHAIEAQGN